MATTTKKKAGTKKPAMPKKGSKEAQARKGKATSKNGGKGKGKATAKKADATPKPELKLTMQAVKSYVKDHATDDQYAPVKGLPFQQNGSIYITVKHLLATALKDDEAASRGTVPKALRELGFDLIQFSVTKKDGGKTAPAYWRKEEKVSGVKEREAPARASKNGDSEDPQEDAGDE